MDLSQKLESPCKNCHKMDFHHRNIIGYPGIPKFDQCPSGLPTSVRLGGLQPGVAALNMVKQPALWWAAQHLSNRNQWIDFREKLLRPWFLAWNSLGFLYFPWISTDISTYHLPPFVATFFVTVHLPFTRWFTHRSHYIPRWYCNMEVLNHPFIKGSWEAILPCYGQIEFCDLKWCRVVDHITIHNITIHNKRIRSSGIDFDEGWW